MQKFSNLEKNFALVGFPSKFALSSPGADNMLIKLLYQDCCGVSQQGQLVGVSGFVEFSSDGSNQRACLWEIVSHASTSISHMRRRLYFMHTVFWSFVPLARTASQRQIPSPKATESCSRRPGNDFPGRDLLDLIRRTPTPPYDRWQRSESRITTQA